ncbi:hypothetical protein EYR38_008663 [Pleurotus pulmonarius]|nr:hypothetical protein EYR38_008663 [Pleurotus pulmonarius]
MAFPRTQSLFFIITLLLAVLLVNWLQPKDIAMNVSQTRTIIIGGGLAGLSAAHTLIQHGAQVLLLDKKPSLGGNSMKASSGINGAGTEAQKALGVSDSVEAFAKDTTSSAGQLARPDLIHALTSNSAESLSWLSSNFSIDLSLVSLLGGHSIARTHRGRGPPPGFSITSALMKKLDTLPAAEIIKFANVVRLLEANGRVSGVEYETNGETKTVEANAVIIATGGYAADYAPAGLLAKYRPDLLGLPTTNGDHATGDGHRLASSLHASLIDMDEIQVHPTGFVDPKDEGAKTKFLAAEALRGVGALLVDAEGKRFVDEMERRDNVTKAMQEIIEQGKGPIRLLLNADAETELKSHCDFYVSKGLMKKYDNAADFARDTGVPNAALVQTLSEHNKYALGELKDPFGKVHFHNGQFSPDGTLLAAWVVPVVHYTMGGIRVDASARVLSADGKAIPGLYAAGEVIGGVHGKNRLGGSSLLEAVVFGRLAGAAAVEAK